MKGTHPKKRVNPIPMITTITEIFNPVLKKPALKDLILGRVDILLLLPRETLNQWKSCQKPSFEEKTRFLFSVFSVSEPIYTSLLSSYDEMSTKT